MTLLLQKWEYSNLSGKSCYLDVTPNSPNQFERECQTARREKYQSDLGSWVKPLPPRVTSI